MSCCERVSPVTSGRSPSLFALRVMSPSGAVFIPASLVAYWTTEWPKREGGVDTGLWRPSLKRPGRLCLSLLEPGCCVLRCPSGLLERAALESCPEARTRHGGDGMEESHGPGPQVTEAHRPYAQPLWPPSGGPGGQPRTAQATQNVPRCHKSLPSKPLRRASWGVDVMGSTTGPKWVVVTFLLAEPDWLHLGLLSVFRKPTNQPAFMVSSHSRTCQCALSRDRKCSLFIF